MKRTNSAFEAGKATFELVDRIVLKLRVSSKKLSSQSKHTVLPLKEFAR